MNRTLILLGLSSIVLTASARTYKLQTFKTTQLTDQFWSEGANFGDFNHDGKMDVVSGPYWYEGPDFKVRHEFAPATESFKKKNADGTETTIPGFEGALGEKNTYTQNFFAFTSDFNHDGWTDILILGFPGAESWWFENPRAAGISGKEAHWKRHLALDVTDNESPTFGDLTGDGKPEIICSSKGFMGYAEPDWKNPTNKFIWHNISENKNYHRFTHGLGYGDVNGDGRNDILEKDGWYEQPKSLAGDPVWKFHPIAFAGGHGASQMYVYDVNGDGLPDVICALAAHGYGLAWYEQLKEKNASGEIQFKQHLILNPDGKPNQYGVAFSQLHAVDLVDMDGDGLKDIVTGKRYWAHGKHGPDPDSDGIAVLYWFQLVRTVEPEPVVESLEGQSAAALKARNMHKSAMFIPHLIDSDSGIGTQVVTGDINGDKLPDIIVGNKKGTFVTVHGTKKVSKEEWEAAQPKTGGTK